jgi:homoserine O-acetyltransferase/O-succinyltransferase
VADPDLRPETSRRLLARGLLVAALCVASLARAEAAWPTREGDYVVQGFRFQSGEVIPELRLHWTTLGTPIRSAAGHVTNAVLILHGTGGDGHQFLRPQFADELFGPGQPLDIQKYYVILPDGIGHGQSSRPSDGLHARFPAYGYDDMVAAQFALLTDGLKVDHLRLVMGTSMGCMHSFVWGETHPGFMDALMPLACLPLQIAGRNRMWRRMLIDAIREDPAWKGGDYTEQPLAALRTAADLLAIAGSAPLYLQTTLPSRDSADARVEENTKTSLASLDANNLLYQVSASRDYDPSARLGAISVPVTWINSADDFINPPELGIAEQQVKRLQHGRFILIPISPQTRGHGTHTWAALWKSHLAALLAEPTPGPTR